MKKAFALLRQKLFFYSSSKQHFLKKQRIEYKKIFFFQCDRWNETQCQCMLLILFSIQKEKEKTTENIDDSQQKNLLKWETTKNTLSRCILYAHTYTSSTRYLENTCGWRAVLGAYLAAFDTSIKSFLLLFKRNTFIPLTVPALAYIRTYTHSHLLTHTHVHE